MIPASAFRRQRNNDTRPRPLWYSVHHPNANANANSNANPHASVNGRPLFSPTPLRVHVQQRRSAREAGPLRALWEHHWLGQQLALVDFPLSVGDEVRRCVAELCGTFWLTFTHAGLSAIKERTASDVGLDFTGT